MKGDLLATSTSTVAGEEHSIFIHSTTELSRSESCQNTENQPCTPCNLRGASPGEAVWERRLVCNTEDEADPHIALTKTCLFAVSRSIFIKIPCFPMGTFQKLLSRFFPLGGGGYLPFPLRVFLANDFPLRGKRQGGSPLNGQNPLSSF